MEIKRYFSSLFKTRLKKLPPKDQEFKNSIERIVNYSIGDLEIFRQAFTVRSDEKPNHYQRLEFLGDAILGSIVSGYIYENYPNADEGFLTKMKSKVVNRKSLNALGEKLQLSDLILGCSKDLKLSENIEGNLVEALIGAVYEDIDYEGCRDVVTYLLFSEQNIKAFEKRVISYKSLLLEWAQKNKRNLRFEANENNLVDQMVYFQSSVWLDDQKISEAEGRSKKQAAEKAAQLAYFQMQDDQVNHDKEKEVSA